MAITVSHVEELLTEIGIKNFDAREHYILFAMQTDHYASPDGTPLLRLVLELQEEGQYLKLFAPRAYEVTGLHVDPFLRASAMIQWRTKLIQFEYDDSDGEVRPIIEWPIQDGTLTAEQLRRSVAGIVELVEHFHPVLERARIEGVVEFPSTKEAMIERLERLVANLKGVPYGDEGNDTPPTEF